eukprot:TRINITY_DN2554_c0_g1_i2.p1 TRINITY_DN2554_c0_g1~~TRINITY_DN2554_c0_g1_i2.p1  ORF type:complete len:146 (-),score=27.61 TRINITY_DN2554_c0_g1_i2:83-520(-)
MEESEENRSKCLVAISSLVRGYADGETAFLNSSGINFIKNIIVDTQNSDNLKMRAIFFLGNLLRGRNVGEEIKQFKIIPALIPLLKSGDVDLREKVLEVLDLVVLDVDDVKECQLLNLGEVLDFVKQSTTLQEELDLCDRIKSKI